MDSTAGDNSKPSQSGTATEPQKPGGAFANLLFNLIIPVFILMKLSSPEKLGPLWGLLLAIAFPLAYGGYDLYKERKWNFMSILGLVSVLLTGGFVLAKLDGIWFSIKEAAVPAVIGVGILFAAKTKYSIVEKLFFNPALVDVDAIQAALATSPERKQRFQILIRRTTYLISLSFLLSAILNFSLAEIILKSPSGTEAFNQELGKMQALSFPVIMVPCTIVLMGSMWYLFRGVKTITGLKNVFREQ